MLENFKCPETCGKLCISRRARGREKTAIYLSDKKFKMAPLFQNGCQWVELHSDA